jgi:hypothetical protein
VSTDVLISTRSRTRAHKDGDVDGDGDAFLTGNQFELFHLSTGISRPMSKALAELVSKETHARRRRGEIYSPRVHGELATDTGSRFAELARPRARYHYTCTPCAPTVSHGCAIILHPSNLSPANVCTVGATRTRILGVLKSL